MDEVEVDTIIFGADELEEDSSFFGADEFEEDSSFSGADEFEEVMDKWSEKKRNNLLKDISTNWLQRKVNTMEKKQQLDNVKVIG